MKPTIAGASRQLRAPSSPGFIMIISVIIISALISVIIIRVALGSLSSVNNFNIALKSAKINNLVETGANEALLSLNRDNAYSGSTLIYADGTCVVAISGTGNNREITVNAVDSDSRSQSLVIKVNISPFAITAWDN